MQNQTEKYFRPRVRIQSDLVKFEKLTSGKQTKGQMKRAEQRTAEEKRSHINRKRA